MENNDLNKLKGDSDGQALVTDHAPAADSAQPESKQNDPIQHHDFGKPVYLSANDRRNLGIQHDNFIRSACARISVLLRMEFALHAVKLQTVPFREFKSKLADPTQLSLFQVEPQQGICLLEISPRLALTFVDRLLGGPGQTANSDRQLSEIEVALLSQIVEVLLNEWCGSWAQVHDLRPVILGHETTGQFLNTSRPDAVILAFEMEARIGECIDRIQFGFPFQTIEPFLKKTGVKTGSETDDQTPAAPTCPLRWNKLLDAVSVRVGAKWPRYIISTGQLARLRPGDVLPIDPSCLEQVEISIGGIPKFIGKLGASDGKRAMQITGVTHGG